MCRGEANLLDPAAQRGLVVLVALHEELERLGDAALALDLELDHEEVLVALLGVLAVLADELRAGLSPEHFSDQAPLGRRPFWKIRHWIIFLMYWLDREFVTEVFHF